MILSTYESDAMVGKWFGSPFAWERSYSGNCYRYWRGKRITVFQKKGFFYWVIDGKPPTYSGRAFRTENEAINHLHDKLRQDDEAQAKDKSTAAR